MARIDFRWILKDRLAGASKPGLFDEVESDFELLHARGIRLLVTLTEDPLESDGAAHGLEVVHFPIDDMGIPTPRDTFALCLRILLAIDHQKPVAVHCKAGIGRTGTILACALVTDGMEPQEAIQKIRRVNPSYIQTQGQERFVEHYADFLYEDGFLEGDREPKTASQLPPLRLKLPT